MRSLALAGCIAIALALVPGCVEQESTTDPGGTCVTRFVTIHYATEERNVTSESLRQAFEAAGWTWRDDASTTQGVASLTPPGDATANGTVSYNPGSSGEDLILSIEESGAASAAGNVGVLAREASDIVNATIPDAQVARWIEDEHAATCEPFGGPRSDID